MNSSEVQADPIEADDDGSVDKPLTIHEHCPNKSQ